ncbi:MAG TPA: glutamate synthase large subunit, partial [Acidobacteriota bacterium]|nr:glutamate synthase large subunit [Acidobacteriota bacterium]
LFNWNRSPQWRETAREILAVRNLEVVDWRTVPTRPEVLGAIAASSLPEILHLVVKGNLSRKNLFLARRELEKRIADCAVVSFSADVIVYKALAQAQDLEAFYPDLSAGDYDSHFVVFHQRYSTNTFPAWRLAQPFRALAHNGEINTIAGNRLWWRSREDRFLRAVFGDEAEIAAPVLQENASDSQSLDNVFEFLQAAGWDPFRAAVALIPQAWEKDSSLDEGMRRFYRYHGAFLEPWDGPAAVVFSDGAKLGAVLDRNGFRPLRLVRSRDGLVVAGSEFGMVDVDPASIVEQRNLEPGEIVGIDFEASAFLDDAAVKGAVADASTQEAAGVRFSGLSEGGARRGRLDSECEGRGDVEFRQRLEGYSREEWEFIVQPMIQEGKEPVGSMGDDTPLAVLSDRRRPLFHYFRQRFSQVTNPPMDPLRESGVMSLGLLLGRRPNPFLPGREGAGQIQLESPFLTLDQLNEICHLRRTAVCDPCFSPGESLQGRLQELLDGALRAVAEGKDILVVSQRSAGRDRIAIPSALAIGYLQHGLIHRGVRCEIDLVVDSEDVRDSHHFAVLIGYGASGVCPRLVLESLEDERQVGQYRKAVEDGLLKILSKMGICTMPGYHGAQVFEILGLGPEIVEDCFLGTPSPIGGLTYDELRMELEGRHAEAVALEGLVLGGFHRYRKGEEHHDFNPAVVKALQAVAQGKEGAYARFQEVLAARPPVSLKDLLEFRCDGELPLEEIEGAEAIFKRFHSSAMSLGALSPEAHETLTIAMNRIGARSNSGEGGEDPERTRSRGSNSDRSSRIKQVASGRFGVTTEYLVSADQLQIKMAQGSKPGEGGQLPGHKVTDYIGFLRKADAGTTLISPPPHHDIYSIEDLSQLIFDLKTVNPSAEISVKLVSESGVGAVAAGVVKAGADQVLISGNNGGTGASPRTSIKYAGTPWELGLSETQQVLLANGLRSRVRLAVDGGFKNGRDIIIAAMLGAEEFGFGTSALVAAGCVMARACHENTCPAGIATQDPALRKRFVRDPDRVIRYLTSLAEEIRYLLSRIGVRSLGELIGRTDLLEIRKLQAGKSRHLDLSPLLHRPQENRIRRVEGAGRRRNRLDRLIESSLQANEGMSLAFPINNGERSVGAEMSGKLALWRLQGNRFDREIAAEFSGVAGLSFGAFNEQGIHLTLIGEANDYAGKGMSGGRIIIRARPESGAQSSSFAVAGNTVLYGATGGEFFAAGRAGQRFAVRNSGCTAVVEGVGDHGCEYMTAGTVVILGPVGRNFGAGMTGGVAYVLDPTGLLSRQAAADSVAWGAVDEEEELERLHRLIWMHSRWTHSQRAADLLQDWKRVREQVARVLPADKAASAVPLVASAG